MECLYPVRYLDKKIGEYKYHRCGYCIACRKKRSLQFALRADHEGKYYEDKIMLNLSYDDDHIHPPKMYPFSGNLYYKDVSNFWKSLRSYGLDIKYLVAGEYGENTFRPHYHCLVYGLNVDSDIFYQKTWNEKKKAYICKCKFWPHGDVVVGPVRQGGSFYVTKYATKEDTQVNLRKEMKKKGQNKPFIHVSQGLGLRYFLERPHYYVKTGFMLYKGKKVPIPDYYLKKYEEVYYPDEDADLRMNEKSREKHKEIIETTPSGYLPFEWKKERNKQAEINLKKGK